MKKLHYILVALITLSVASCEKDELSPNSIFIDPVVDTTTATYWFDCWIDTFFTQHYNVDFIYKLDDNAMDPNYNVVPVRVGTADTVAHLALYLWYDVYDSIVGADFLTTYGPKMIQLVGSSMINAAQGTEKLGYAEGGIKITLMKINDMQKEKYNTDWMNEYIFKTMHHEFSHILHQHKMYPKEFDQITPEAYDPSSWYLRTEQEAWEFGCVSAYASSQGREDFVETIANYIVKSDAWWQNMLNKAGKESAEKITTKLEMVRKYLADNYKYDIDKMHKEVQVRQKYLDYDKIMKMDFSHPKE